MVISNMEMTREMEMTLFTCYFVLHSVGKLEQLIDPSDGE